MPTKAGIWGFPRKLTYLPFPPRSSIPAKAGISLFCRQRRGFAASPLESGDSRFRGNGGWGGMGGLGDLGGDSRHTLPFPPRSSIPAKAGISRGGIVRHASPQAILCFRFAEFPAKAGRDSRASGNGRGGMGEWGGFRRPTPFHSCEGRNLCGDSRIRR